MVQPAVWFNVLFGLRPGIVSTDDGGSGLIPYTTMLDLLYDIQPDMLRMT